MSYKQLEPDSFLSDHTHANFWELLLSVISGWCVLLLVTGPGREKVSELATAS